MTKGRLLRQWNQFFRRQQKNGHTLEEIRTRLLDKGYNRYLIGGLISNYRKDRLLDYANIFIVCSIFFVIAVKLLLFPSGITGMVFFEGNSDHLGLANGENILFVDQYNLDCDDSYSRTQALSGETPWCNLDAALSRVQGGDSVYVSDGRYVGRPFRLNDRTLSARIRITAYPGQSPVLTSAISDFWSASGSPWTFAGDGTHNLWYSSYSSSEKSWAGTYTDSGISLFTYSSDFSLQKSLSDFNNPDNPEGIFYDTGNHRIYVRFDDLDIDPNELSLSLSDANVFEISNVDGAGVEVSNFTIESGVRGIYVKDSSNIDILDNTLSGGLKSIDVRRSDNVIVRGDEVYMKQGDDWTWYDDMKKSAMETTAVWLEDDYEGIEVDHNDVHGHFNGIMAYSKSQGKFEDIKVHHNYVYDIYDDAIEIEDYCNGGKYYFNNVSDAFVAVSLSPVDASEEQCEIYNNILVADKNIKWSHSGTHYYGECYKIIDNEQTQNVVFRSNTCIGKGVYTTSDKYDTQEDDYWHDNLFYSTNQRVLEKSGLASDGVIYDYNLYYRTDNGALFRYWNDDYDTTQFSSLSSALNSGNDPGNWDRHSKNANPLFNDLAAKDYRPKANSQACTMSSTGSYVGALPCIGMEDSFCGDGTCDAGEDCSICLDDCGVCPPPATFCGDGSCDDNESCSICSDDCGACPPPATFCGDGTCDAGEDCSICIDDCGACSPPATFCGDGSCDDNESCSICSDDCGACPPPATFCGDGTCDAGEDCSICIDDCGACSPPATFCGDGSCDDNESCSICSDDCGACPPPATFCGDGSCDDNESCSICSDDCGACPPPATFCGDGTCDAGEDCSICIDDCGACPPPATFCGDGSCDDNESCSICSDDCGACPPPATFCGDGSCDDNESCSICSDDCGACEIKKTSSSGGGGGGGSNIQPMPITSELTSETTTTSETAMDSVPVQTIRTTGAEDDSPGFSAGANDILELVNDINSQIVNIVSVGNDNLTIKVGNQSYDFQTGQTRFFDGFGLRLDSIAGGKGEFTLMTDSTKKEAVNDAPVPLQQKETDDVIYDVDKNSTASKIETGPIEPGNEKNRHFFTLAVILGLIGLVSLIYFRKGAYRFLDLRSRLLK